MADDPELPLPEEVEVAIRAMLAKNPKLGEVAVAFRKKYRAAPPEKRDLVAKNIVFMAHEAGRPIGWKGKVVLGAILMIPLGVLAWNQWSDERALEAAFAASTPAIAKVTRMESEGGNKDARTVHLGLEVHQEHRKPFAAEMTARVNIEWLPRVQAGSWMRVGVGKDRSVVFDRKSMEVEPPAPPAY